MIKAVIVGYGNIGKSAYEAIKAAEDFTLSGIILHSKNKPVPAEIQNEKIFYDINELTEKPDAAILCCPSTKVPENAEIYLKKGINTVDSYDIHSGIYGLKTTLDPLAKANGAVSIIAAGWDPGSDSVIRALFEYMAPKGLTYTNFGPGMSMGHTVAVRAIEGVKNALSMTIPKGASVHMRSVYIEVKEGYDFGEITRKIKSDPYFVHDETYVTQVDNLEKILDMGHASNITRKGVSGTTHNQNFEFNMKINNPALTAQILIASARAAGKQVPGCYTVIEIPPIDFIFGDKEEIIRRLV